MPVVARAGPGKDLAHQILGAHCEPNSPERRQRCQRGNLRPVHRTSQRLKESQRAGIGCRHMILGTPSPLMEGSIPARDSDNRRLLLRIPISQSDAPILGSPAGAGHLALQGRGECNQIGGTREIQQVTTTMSGPEIGDLPSEARILRRRPVDPRSCSHRRLG